MTLKEYVQLLKRTGAELDRIRVEELRASPSPWKAARALDGNFQLALKTKPPAPTSGLVEFQRLLHRKRR